MDNVVALVLVSGEEVVGRVAGETDRGIDLADAMCMFYAAPESAERSNGVHIIFRKYTLLTNEYDVFFKKEHVLNIFTDLRPDVVEAYEYTLNATKESDQFENLMSDKITDDDEAREELDRFLSKFKKNNGNGTIH